MCSSFCCVCVCVRMFFLMPTNSSVWGPVGSCWRTFASAIRDRKSIISCCISYGERCALTRLCSALLRLSGTSTRRVLPCCCCRVAPSYLMPCRRVWNVIEIISQKGNGAYTRQTGARRRQHTVQKIKEERECKRAQIEREHVTSKREHII